MTASSQQWLQQSFSPLHTAAITTTYVGTKLKIRIDIGIKHVFSCINVCQVPREVLKTEAEGRGFQHLPRDLANVNALENNV